MFVGSIKSLFLTISTIEADKIETQRLTQTALHSKELNEILPAIY